MYGMRSPQMGLCPGGSQGPAGYPCFTNVYNSQLPKVREAQFIRRTDQATNNPYMWFEIDDQYAYNIQGLSTDITVTYWDRGTDKFRLQYDSFSGPKYATPQGGSNPWVQKTNSGQFRQVVFRLNDARFTNSLPEGIDFKLDSRNENGVNDGDEWIHLVDVRVFDPTAPTPVNTPTRTPLADQHANAYQHADAHADGHQHANSRQPRQPRPRVPRRQRQVRRGSSSSEGSTCR